MNAKPCLARRLATGPLTAAFAAAAALASAANAASFDFSGALQAASLTGIPWVRVPINPPALEPAIGSVMWGSLETGSGAGTSQSGFTYLSSRDVGLLTFSFGDLELSSWQSPLEGAMGFERYTDTDGSSVPFTIRYDGTIIATGTSDYLYDEVDHIFDIAAVGSGQVTLTAPGADPAFFNEVMGLTGGSGQLQLQLHTFDPVDFGGNFSTTGTFSTTPVPEPEEYAAVAAAGLIGWAVWRRRQRG